MRRAAMLALVLLTSAVSAQNQMPAGYDDPGPKPENVLPAIIAELRSTLRDPTSVRDFVICEPELTKAFQYPGAGKVWERAHWTVRFSLNARNGFGGYAGRQPFSATYIEGKLKSVDSPNLGPELNAKLVHLTSGCPRIADDEIERMFQR